MKYNDTIGIKILESSSIAQTIKILRKYLPLSISEIQSIIGSDTYIFSCDCTDEKGLGLITKLYNQLTKAGCSLELYDGNDLASIDQIRNLKGSVRETRLSFGDLDDDEI